jgi:hypothetical protein
MSTEPKDFLHEVENLVDSTRYALGSDDPMRRVAAIRRLTTGMEILQDRIVLDAHDEDDMTWAAIGTVYGISRQAAHKRFSNESEWPAEAFDALLSENDDPVDPDHPLIRAAARAHRIVKTPSGVPH